MKALFTICSILISSSLLQAQNNWSNLGKSKSEVLLEMSISSHVGSAAMEVLRLDDLRNGHSGFNRLGLNADIGVISSVRSFKAVEGVHFLCYTGMGIGTQYGRTGGGLFGYRTELHDVHLEVAPTLRRNVTNKFSVDIYALVAPSYAKMYVDYEALQMDSFEYTGNAISTRSLFTRWGVGSRVSIGRLILGYEYSWGTYSADFWISQPELVPDPIFGELIRYEDREERIDVLTSRVEFMVGVKF